MRVTGIGGGHGLAASLKAARSYASEVRAVVTVADDGGSSGRLTRELGIPPPGDIRNCLVALAENSEMAELFQFRFGAGALTGHTVGNLVIAALAEKSGDFGEAVEQARRLLRCSGKVFPATTALVALRAVVEGDIVRGQVAVAQVTNRIQALFLEPDDASAHPGAVEAILDGDQLVMGPGSLFTSVIATLLLPDLKEAVNRTKATRIFVCNSRMQKGETQGYDGVAHIEALTAHLGTPCVDVAIVQEPRVQPDGVYIDADAFRALGIEVVEADVVDQDGSHDPSRLAQVLSVLR